MAAAPIEFDRARGDGRDTIPILHLLRPPPNPFSSLRGRALIAVAALSFVVAGCANTALGDWSPFGKKSDQQPIPDPVEYDPKLTVDGGTHAVEKALRDASVLVDRRKVPTSGVAGLIARARQDVGQLTAVLYQHAYYAGQIAIAVDGKPLNAISPFDPITTRPVPVEIHVATGERFVFGNVATPQLPHGVSLSRVGLVEGRPADSGRIVAAETAIADAWREQGHPLVAIKPREVIADHDSLKVDVKLDIEPGPMARFGRVTVTGLKDVDGALVVGRAALDGSYSSTATKNATKRLRDLGVFDSVRITPDDKLDADGSIPMNVAVTERKQHVVGGSIYYSNTEGSGIESFWRHRNLWGGAEQLEVRGAVSRLGQHGFTPDYRLGTILKKPGILDPLTDGTLRVEAYRQTTDAYRVRAFENEVSLSRLFSDTLTGSLGLESQRSRTDDLNGTQDHFIVGLRGRLEWDTRDNRLDPLTGFRNQLLVAPAHDFKYRENFVTVGDDVSAYYAFGADRRFVLAGRFAAYSLAARNALDVPADRRQYAGGAGSVRGYGYKNIAPRNDKDEIIGGRSSVAMTAELRYRLNEQFGLAAFVDAGNATTRIGPSFSDLKTGVGVGLRYLTPVGPLRLDVAVPMQPGPGDPRVAVYVGLGQAF